MLYDVFIVVMVTENSSKDDDCSEEKSLEVYSYVTIVTVLYIVTMVIGVTTATSSYSGYTQ